jgi:octaprenyl-diphosphate synthase
MIADAPNEVVQALYAYGDALGISFQIADDILDFAGDTAKTGKNIGDDFRERKLTLPLIKAIAAGGDNDHDFWVRTIEKGKQENGDLDHVLLLLKKHGALEGARQDALEWSDKAKQALDSVPQGELTDMLRDLADYVVLRLN